MQRNDQSTLQLHIISKKWYQCDCRKYISYFCLFLLLLSCVCWTYGDTISMYQDLMWPLPLMHILYIGVLLPCTSFIWVIYIHGYILLSYLTVIDLPWLPSDMRPPSLLGKLFLVSSWNWWVLIPPNALMWWNNGGFDHCSCGFSIWSVVENFTACMYTCICRIYSCGISHIFTCTFLFIVNWRVHQFLFEISECSDLQRLGQYVVPHSLCREVLYFLFTLC